MYKNNNMFLNGQKVMKGTGISCEEGVEVLDFEFWRRE